RRCRFAKLERVIGRLGRPLLMIHGEQDTYIKPETAQALYAKASGPKELWFVEKAKHNQALNVAGKDYDGRIGQFFNRHLGGGDTALPAPAPKCEERQEAQLCETV